MSSWIIIGKGFSGWHAKKKNVSSSSYDRTDRQLNEYVKEAVEGALIYDASQADEAAYVNFVSRGPIVDCSLSEEDSKKYDAQTRKSGLDMCGPGGLSGGFISMLVEEAAQTEADKFDGFGSLDYVSPKTHIRLLKKYIPNVRFGVVKSGKVIWENEFS